MQCDSLAKLVVVNKPLEKGSKDDSACTFVSFPFIVFYVLSKATYVNRQATSRWCRQDFSIYTVLNRTVCVQIIVTVIACIYPLTQASHFHAQLAVLLARRRRLPRLAQNLVWGSPSSRTRMEMVVLLLKSPCTLPSYSEVSGNSFQKLFSASCIGFRNQVFRGFRVYLVKRTAVFPLCAKRYCFVKETYSSF